MMDIKHTRAVSVWLFMVAALVLVMATVGAATRLTESGLSIVEWKPVTGAMAPMNDADWQHEFDAYKTSPQFHKVNADMQLSDYKKIFWWEWAHRLLGRLIGLFYAAGLIWFWARKEIPPKYKLPLLGILALGGAQGVMGWLMVASGLVDNPAVSHYRLAAHLLLAVALYVSCLWTGLEIRGKTQEARDQEKILPLGSNFLPLYRHSIAALWLVIITLTWGAFVAGLRAGLIYNTWPLMDGHIAPPDFWFLHPWWLNFFENHGAVQFTHRCLAYIASLMCISIGLVTYLRKVPMHAARWGYGVAAMGFFQPLLGIITVLTQVKIHAAVAHQAGAFVLIGLLVIWIKKLEARN